ncbi:MAG: choice-of-anchor D domain-containing protein, partial [Prosthecobacter sp.]
GGASFVETNGRVEYRVTTPDVNYDETSRPWALNIARNTDAFDVILDVFNNVNPAGAANASVGISVTSLENTQDSIYMELGRSGPGGDGSGFLAGLSSNVYGGDEVPPYTTPTNHPAVTTGSVRLSYNPTTKIFTAYYDTTGSGDGFQWQSYGTFGVGDAPGNGATRNSPWQLSGNKGFIVSISGFSEALVVSSGSVYADNFSVITTGGAAPTIASASASNVTSITATLNGTVNPNGTATTVTFEYGPNTGYGTSIAATLAPVSGSSALAVSATLSGLTPGATYHYRLVGVNGVGTSNGSDLSFTAASTLNVPRHLVTSLFPPDNGAQTNAQFGTSVAVDGIYTVVGSPLDDAGSTDSGVVKVYHTNTGVLLHTIANPSPATNDQFGISVSVSGSRLIVGAHLDDTGSTDSGNAYVYDLSSGPPSLPTLTLPNPGPASSDNYGYAVAISGSYVAVSARLDDTGASNAGSVYVYDLSAVSPSTPLLTLNNPSPAVNDNFGISVAISGARLVVGAYFDDTGATDAGSAYVFDLTSGTPATPSFTLNNPSAVASDFFGVSVSISGTKVAVGARQDDALAVDSGSVYVYDLAGGTPTTPTLSLGNPDPEASDFFGTSVALSGTNLFVGAIYDNTGAADSGEAYVFDLLSGTPATPLHTLVNPAPLASDEYGYAVAIAGTKLVIGARLDNAGATDAGSAYIYDLTSGTPTVPTATLNSPGSSIDDRFGIGTAISGTRTVIGVPRDKTGANNTGCVYVFDSTSGTPGVPVFTINNPSPAADDNFGNAMAVQGDLVLVGVPYDDTGATNSGITYLYNLGSSTPTVPVLTLTNPAPGANDLYGNSVTLEGTLLIIAAPEDDTAGVDTGSVYVYDLASATPTTPAYVINNPSPSGDDSFGSTVGISGRRIVIAAVSDDPGGIVNAGSVYAYDLNSGTPTVPVAEIVNPQPAANDSFGYHAAISGTRIVVGALADDTLATDAGSAYIYDLTSGTPTVPIYTLPNPTPVASDNFGHSVAIAGNWVTVGASNDGTAAAGSGSAYFYDLSSASPTVPLQTLPNPNPSANDDYGLIMAMDGQRFVVSAPFDDMVSVDKGASYIFGPSSAAEIDVAVIDSAVLTDAGSTVNFGFSVDGLGVQKTFRITNLGGVALTGLALTKSGAHASDFALGTLGSTSLAPGSSTVFTVTFSAAAVSARQAMLHIASNDPDESPFDVTMTGSRLAGSVDPTYDVEVLDGYVNDSIELADGKIMIGGPFSSINGVARVGLARLNSDGTLDTSFAPVTSGYVHAFALQPDGKLLIGGSFTITSGGSSRSNLARLNADGSLDTTLPTINSSIRCLVAQADGRIMIGGYFTTVSGQSRNYIARLNADGSLDLSYNPNASSYVDTMILQPDGKVVIGGWFLTVSGITRNRIARINTDGSLDSGFNPNANSSVEGLAIQPDGKILMGGRFSTVGGVTRNYMARLNTDGSLDSGFFPNLNHLVSSIAIQSDGKILAGGFFTTVAGGFARQRLARFNSDGGVDGAFRADCDDWVKDVMVMSDGRIVAGGRFRLVEGQFNPHLAILSSTGTVLSGGSTDLHGIGGSIWAQSLMPNGKLVIGNYTARVNELLASPIARLLPSGIVDPDFSLPVSTGTYTYTTIPQADGRLVYHDVHILRRLDADGSLDSTFNVISANVTFYAMAMQADGKILAGGPFSTLGGQTRNKLARINANGTLDTTFNPNVGGSTSDVLSLAVQPDGKILVGGSFTTVGGVTRNRIARLNVDGSLDTGFDPGANSTIYAIQVQPDGKILVGGAFTTIAGISRSRLARLNSNGTLDGFAPQPSGTVYALSLQTDGKIWVGGSFTVSIGGGSRNRLARLNADGSLDTGILADLNDDVYSLTQTDEGQVLVGGAFSQANGVARTGHVRLTNTTAIQSLTANSAGTAVSWVRAGSSPEVDRVTFESSLDGSTWTSLGNGTRTTNGWQLAGLALPAAQGYRLRAQGIQMTGGYYGGDSSIYETTAIIPASGGAQPEIVVQQAGLTLTDEVSTMDFGNLELGTALERLFVVLNTGTSDLSGIAVTLDGPHAADYRVRSEPASALAAGGNTSFILRFQPTAPGPRLARLRIHSNDADESSFDINLSGHATATSTPFSVTTTRMSVESFAMLDTGKLLLGGNFNNVADAGYFTLARFNADHSIDTTFPSSGFSQAYVMTKRADGRVWLANNSTGSLLRLLNIDGTTDTGAIYPQPNSQCSAITMQADQKTLLGGNFTTVGGITRNRIARLNADLTLDTDFNPDANGTVLAIAVQADNKILIGGTFTTVGGVSRNRLARLNADGSLDTGFDPNVSSTVESILVLPDGNILLGGNFTSVSGQTRNRIAKLNSAGVLDGSFDPNANGSVIVMTRQTDGKVVLGGSFTSIAGQTRNRIARLEADGSLDYSYDPSADAQINALLLRPDGRLYVGGQFLTIGGQSKWGAALLNADGSVDNGVNLNSNGASVFGGAVQIDGKMLVSGIFAGVNGQAKANLARLMSDGSVDATYSPNPSSWVYSSALLPDGKFVIAGIFSSVGGLSRSYVARLNADGSTDTSFANANVGSYLRCVAVQSDGKLLISGPGLSTVNGVTRNYLARLNADGSLDTGFDPNLNGEVYAVQFLSGGQILIGGNFTTVGGVTRNRLARLNADGTLDLSFNPNPSGTVYAVHLQKDGRIMIGGTFGQVGGVNRSRVARLLADGSLDSSFLATVGGNVYCLSLLTDGKIRIAGSISSVNGVTRSNFAQLNGDGSLDTSVNFNVNDTVYSITSLPEGRCLIGGEFSRVDGQPQHTVAMLTMSTGRQALGISGADVIHWSRTGASPEVDETRFESSLDGVTWNSLGNGTRTSAGWQVSGLTLPTSQSYYVRARGWQMAGSYYNSSNAHDEDVALIYPSGGGPEIALEHPLNTDLVSGSTTHGFGGVNLGSSTTLTYHVRNTGSAPLTGLAVTFSGANAGDFSITTAPQSPLASGSSTTPFIIQFTPQGTDSRAATMQVWSNDADESPFTIDFTGLGVAAAPTATTLAATFIQSDAATLNGSVSDNGASTTISFDYGLTTSYGSNIAATPASLSGGGTSATAVSRMIDGLIPSTTYHFRVRAVNSSGTTLGDDASFTTPVFSPGEIDVGYTPPIVGSHVTATAVQPDGKIIIGGNFTSVNGVPRSNIARLNADGSLDTGFDPKTNGVVYSLAVQPDGKILLGGVFTTLQPNGAVSATTRWNVARVNADGSLDSAFDPKANAEIDAVVLQADGKILLGGGFTTLQPNGAASATTRWYIARVNTDGSLDMGFDPKPGDWVDCVTVQSDGKILLGGWFTTLQPNGAVSPTPRNCVARLNADGSLDAGFDPSANTQVNCLVEQADGKILIGGAFTTLQPNGAITATTRNRIARVNADGSLDTDFDPMANSDIKSLALQTDGKILIGGLFTTLQPNGAVAATSRQRVARINADGSLDTGFDPKASSSVYTVAVQADGKILLGGQFSTLQPNGASSSTVRDRFARLNNDAATQTLTVSNVAQVQWQRGGASPEVSLVTFDRSNDAGATWVPLGNGIRVGTTTNWQLTGISLPSSGQVRARGRTMNGIRNSGSGLIESIQ